MDLDELTPEERFAHEDEAIFVTRDLAAGIPEEEIIEQLLQLEWSESAAWKFVGRAKKELQLHRSSPKGRRQVVDIYFRQMVGGAVLTLIGVLLALYSLVAPSSLGFGITAIFYGKIFTGLVLFSTGRTKWKIYRGDDVGR